MIERIIKNEERYDKVLKSVKDLEIALGNFSCIKKDLTLLTRYYESNNWLNDKDEMEKNKRLDIKAGVLSEDGVWNMLEDIDDLMKNMKRIIVNYERKR